jgi:energy-coupling factor transport system ATP-binding protein
MSVEVHGLNYTYNVGMPTEFRALTDITFDVSAGMILSVVGHTGSGKSTLAYHLNGLIPPQSGEVTVNGVNITKDPKVLRRIRSMVGLVFQYPEQQIFSESVEEEIEFAPRNWGITGSALRERVQSAASTMGLDEELLKRSPFELSGGQKRRVAIASVLASDPYCLVLDEPTAGLDVHGARELIELLERYRESGKCIIHVTHDIDLALRTSDRIAVLEEGRLFAFGTVREIAEKLCRTEVKGIRLPAVLALSKELREFGMTDGISWDPKELAAMIERGK